MMVPEKVNKLAGSEFRQTEEKRSDHVEQGASGATSSLGDPLDPSLARPARPALPSWRQFLISQRSVRFTPYIEGAWEEVRCH